MSSPTGSIMVMPHSTRRDLPSPGAGVRLLDKSGNALDVGQTHAPWLVNSGDSELNFMAALESTGLHVSAGDFSSLVRLKMEYL